MILYNPSDYTCASCKAGAVEGLCYECCQDLKEAFADSYIQASNLSKGYKVIDVRLYSDHRHRRGYGTS